MMNTMNIAIDGPAGAGKSTIAKKVAKNKGYIYVDTGAMYRAMALFFIREGITPDNTEAIEQAASRADVSIEYVNGEQVVLLNGENVNAFLRTEEVGNMASVSSALKEVRAQIFELQRELARTKDVVMDGRDIGTNILPNADVKIYMTASSAVRAKRRFDELVAKGVECNLDEIEKDIIERDYRDMNRETSPLKKADDAYELDTSALDIDGVVKAMKEIIEKVR